MGGVLRIFGRRPVAGVGLAVAAVWIVLAAVEDSTVFPWDQGGWYAVLVGIAADVFHGVLVVVAVVWLVERSEVLSHG